MVLPSAHKINVMDVTAYTPSVGGTPLAAYIRVPFRAQLMKLTSVIYGAITTADCAVAVAINGTHTAACDFTIVQSGSAAGQVNSTVPSASTYVNEDDYITFTPSGASGASIAAMFSAVFKAI